MNKKFSVILIAFFWVTLFISLDLAYSKNLPALLVFHSPSCHKCLQVEKEILPGIEKEYKGRIKIEYYDITDINNYTFLLGLRDKYNKNLELTLPVFFAAGNLINSKGDLKVNLSLLMVSILGKVSKDESLPGVDLVNHFNSFKPIAIAGSGLADGINPCAFTVIVFFISYLALQGYRKRELIVIGTTFIAAVFLTYLLLGLGIFNFLYQLANFWRVIKIFNILIGAFSVALGLLAIYDFFLFRKTQDAQGLILQLPKSVKNRIHSVIGLFYRKTKDFSFSNELRVSNLPKLIISAFITGFLVSILEAVCTGQLYLPTITFILKTTPYKFKALIYLIVYNIMFILPLFVIFVLALFGVTSAQFAKFLGKHMPKIKIIMAIFFISLGVFLIWRA
ncbi:MAG: hypothetical protein NTZ63_00645 [Candidatus Omnitrophica bacterium]|nr:hypothetical protein [Candidatus Omnitrophota bacterium]